MRLVYALVYMPKRAMANHLAQLPFSYRERFFLLLERLRILLQVVLDLGRAEVAIFVVVAFKVILILLVVRVRDLGLAERAYSLVLNVFLPLHRLKNDLSHGGAPAAAIHDLVRHLGHLMI